MMNTGTAQVPLYAAVEGRARRLSEEEVAFFDPAVDRTHVMTAQVLGALETCRAFQPMEAHVAAVIAAQAELRGQDQAVRRVLEGFAARGLLITDDAFLARLRRQPQAAQAEYAGHCLLGEHSPQALQETRAALDTATVPQVFVIDEALRQRVLADLIAAVPDQAEAVRALIAPRGGSVSADRNLASLLAAGARYTCSEAAQSLAFRRHPGHLPGLGFEPAPWQAQTHASVEALMSAGAPLDVDAALAMSLSACGRTLGDALADAGSGVDFGPAGLRGRAPSHAPALRGETRFAVIALGQRGVFAADANPWLYLLDPRARGEWLTDAQRYADLKDAVPTWRGSAWMQVGSGGQARPFAFDASRMLPGLPQVGTSRAGEDALFMSLCQVLDPAAQMLEWPVSLARRAPVAAGSSASTAEPEAIGMADFLADLAAGVAGELLSQDTAVRWQVLLARMADLQAADERTLLGHLREFFVHRHASALQRLQAVYAGSPDAPDGWRDALRDLIQAHAAMVIERAVPRFASWPAGLGSADCIERFRRELAMQAAQLRVWPALWEIALANRRRWAGAAG